MARPDSAETIRILVVEDDPLVRSALQRALQRFYSVHAAASVDQALATAKQQPIDVVLTDLDLQDSAGRCGLWLLDRLCADGTTRGLALTGKAIQHPRHRILRKPSTSATLRSAIEAVAAAPPQGSRKPSEVE